MVFGIMQSREKETGFEENVIWNVHLLNLDWKCNESKYHQKIDDKSIKEVYHLPG